MITEQGNVSKSIHAHRSLTGNADRTIAHTCSCKEDKHFKPGEVNKATRRNGNTGLGQFPINIIHRTYKNIPSGPSWLSYPWCLLPQYIHCFNREMAYSGSGQGLAGRTYVVTGGASGIGLAVTKELLRIPATVHILDIQNTAPEDLSQTSSVHFHGSTDVSSRQAVSAAFARINEQSGEIHGLINCAGISPTSAGHIETDQAFDRIMSVNAGGVWTVGTEYLRYIMARNEGGAPVAGGSLVNIGSAACHRGFRGLAAYCASKHAVLGLTRAWAQEFASLGVRVNCIAPGAIDTPLLRRTLDDPVDVVVKAPFGQIAMGRYGSTAELASVVLFLLGDGASFITGQIIPVDGGLQ